MTEDPYSRLGVARDADPDTIKRAYRQHAKRTHPDRPGGDKEAFQAVNLAYAVLSDQTRRAHYDKTGEAAQEDSFPILSGALCDLFLQAAEQVPDVAHVDLLQLVRNNLRQQRGRNRELLEQAEDRIARLEAVLERVTYKGKQANVLESGLRQRITQLQRNIERGRGELADLDKLIAMAAEYEYRVERQHDPYSGPSPLGGILYCGPST